MLGLYPITGNASVAGMGLGTDPTEITADLYRYPDLDTPVATLDLSHSRQWQDALSEPGAATITLQADDPALAFFEDDGDDVVVFSYRGQRVFAMLAEAKQGTVVSEGEEVEQVVVYSGRGHLALLERVVVYPALGVGQLPVEEDRVFNWTSPYFDSDQWVAAKNVGTVQEHIDWQYGLTGLDPSTFDSGLPSNLITFYGPPQGTFYDAPEGDTYYRMVFNVAADGTYLVYFAADNSGELYLDGTRVLEVQPSWLSVAETKVALSAGLHMAAWHVNNADGNPGTNPTKGTFAVWTMTDLGEPGTSVASAAPFTKVSAYPTGGPPGITVGKAMRLCVEEAQARGYLTDLVLGFSDDYDTDGVPWPVSADIATKTGTDVLTFFRELAATYCDLWMDPAGVRLCAWNIDGRGQTLPVTLLSPTDVDDPGSGNLISYVRTGEFSPVGSLLLRYRDGWAERVDAASVAAYGRREALLEIGAPGSVDEVYRMADGQFSWFANPRTEITAGVLPMSLDDTPYIAFRVGDSVTCPDGVERVLAITCAEDNETDQVAWTLTLRDVILGWSERAAQALGKVG